MASRDVSARNDAANLAILGTGKQAEEHLRAIGEVRNLRRVRVWGRSLEKAEKLAEAGGRERDIRFEVAHTARQAVDGADIICTVTSAREPVLEGAWLADGVHVNLVGASVAAAREGDDEVVTRSKFFVDFSRRPTNRRANCVTRCRRAWLKNAMFWVKSAKC